MKINKYEIAIMAAVILFFAVGVYFYPQMPERVASHWNAQGQADGYMSRFWGVFLMPFISVGLVLLLLLVPRIDPLKANIKEFQKYYYGFIAVMLLFFFYLYLLTIVWNLGARFDMVRFLLPAFAVIFYGAGVLIEKSKRNYFIGIRTPWTLNSDRVWAKTHRIGGILFKVSAVFSLIGVFLPDYAIFFMLVPVILASIFTVIYSYFEYQKEVRARGA